MRARPEMRLHALNTTAPDAPIEAHVDELMIGHGKLLGPCGEGHDVRI
jgi:hypothetical protein